MTYTPAAVLETALYAPDLDAVANFYGGFLGLEEITREAGRHVFFRCRPGVLLLFNPTATSDVSTTGRLPIPPHGAYGPGHVCFRAEVNDLDELVRRFDEADIAVEADFEWPTGGRSVYVRDPAGNSVEFAEPRIWGL